MRQIRSKALGFETSDGTPFLPRGAQYIRRLETGLDGFDTFASDFYKPDEIEQVAAAFEAYGLNVVRIFAGFGNRELASGSTINPHFVKNVADFIERMAKRGVRTILELSGSHELSKYERYYSRVPHVAGENESLFNPYWIEAKKQYTIDYLKLLKGYLPSVEPMLFSVELRNELSANAEEEPLSSISGPFTFPNQPQSQPYDLGNAKSRRKLISDGLSFFARTLIPAVHSELPNVMVSASTVPQCGWRRDDLDDNFPDPNNVKYPQIGLDPYDLCISPFSYVDVHWYWHSDEVKKSIDWDTAVAKCLALGKGTLAGEFGTHNLNEPGWNGYIDDEDQAVDRLRQFWSGMNSTVAGIVYWTYNQRTHDTWQASSETGKILRLMAEFAGKQPLSDPHYFECPPGTGVTWFTDGYSSRSFDSNEFFQLHRVGTGAPLGGARNGPVGPDLGRCPLSRGRFGWRTTQYHSEGNGSFYYISGAQYPLHVHRHPGAVYLGDIVEDQPYRPPMYGGGAWDERI